MGVSAAEDARGVDEHVEATKQVDALRDDGLDRRLVRDVEHAGGQPVAVGAVSGLLEAAFGDVHRNDVRALGEKAQDGRLADRVEDGVDAGRVDVRAAATLEPCLHGELADDGDPGFGGAGRGRDPFGEGEHPLHAAVHHRFVEFTALHRRHDLGVGDPTAARHFETGFQGGDPVADGPQSETTAPSNPTRRAGPG